MYKFGELDSIELAHIVCAVESGQEGWDWSLEHEEEPDFEFDDGMDGDAASALASAGWGTDEDYGYYGED